MGDYYLRFLLTETNTDTTPIHNPLEFFNNVYHRFLLTQRHEMRCVCLKAMGIIYERHFITIGPFSDTRYIVEMLMKCTNLAERDHFIFLISKLALNIVNVRELTMVRCIPILLDLAVLSHLQTGRAKLHTHQTNLIAYPTSGGTDESKEWYYNDKQGQRQGPLSFLQVSYYNTNC